mgnify:CR=1 FL=1
MAILYTYISKHTISRSHLSIEFIIYPLVALEFGIILPGFPNTMLSSGTSKLTNAPGAISTLFPILILPTTIAFVPIQTEFPIIGVPFLSPRL